MSIARNLPIVLVAALALVACSDSNKVKLPGQRISVLSLERQLKPDPAVANVQVALPAPALNRDWPQAGGVPTHAMGHPALGAGLKPAWSVDLGEGTSRYARTLVSPVVVDGVVYAEDAVSAVKAVSAADGRELWHFDVTPPNADENRAWGGGIAYDGGRLYVSTGFGQVIALDARSGKELWRSALGSPFHAAPTVADGRLFVINVENQLFALNTQDGKRIWSFDGIPETGALAGGASPAVSGGTVIAAFTSGELVALRVENGRVVWQDSLATTQRFDPMSTLADIHGRPVVSGGRIFAISQSGRMAAIDERSGGVIWEQEIGGSSTPWVAGDYVYVLSTEGQVGCLSVADGRVRWATQLDRWEDMEDHEDPIQWSGPVLAGDRLIVLASNGQAMTLSPYTGRPLGRLELPAGSFQTPVVAAGTLYLVTDNATLTAYR